MVYVRVHVVLLVPVPWYRYVRVVRLNTVAARETDSTVHSSLRTRITVFTTSIYLSPFELLYVQSAIHHPAPPPVVLLPEVCCPRRAQQAEYVHYMQSRGRSAGNGNGNGNGVPHHTENNGMCMYYCLRLCVCRRGQVQRCLWGKRHAVASVLVVVCGRLGGRVLHRRTPVYESMATQHPPAHPPALQTPHRFGPLKPTTVADALASTKN